MIVGVIQVHASDALFCYFTFFGHMQSQRITKCAPLLQNRPLLAKAMFHKVVNKLLAFYDSRRVITVFT